MILSPYRNPPYRSPTPRDSTSPQTPKRKREDPPDSDDRPLEHDTHDQTEVIENTGANSPRTKVADKFQKLDIRHSHAARPQIGELGVQRKRFKRQAGAHERLLQIKSPSPEHDDLGANQGSPLEARNATTTEVEETPDCRTRERRSPSSSPIRPIAYVETTPPKRQKFHLDSAAIELPSSPGNLLAIHAQPADVIDRSASPLPAKGDLTPDQAALTWQEHEITGHEIDPGGEDDGEGINGIGFRPTAAIAAARQQRRKQQLNEWKAREARDARQKRFERRQGASRGGGGADVGSSGEWAEDDAALSSATKARMVRFVGAGE